MASLLQRKPLPLPSFPNKTTLFVIADRLNDFWVVNGYEKLKSWPTLPGTALKPVVIVEQINAIPSRISDDGAALAPNHA